MLEIEHGSWVSSSQEAEVPEESSKDHNGEVSIQASVTEENRMAEYNDDINEEEKISIGEEASLLVGTEPDARKKNGMQKKLIRAPRYFDPPEKAKENNAKRMRKRCYICGDVGHDGKKRCKKVNDCLICLKKGHLIINCPDKSAEVDCTSRLCLKCGSTGHDMLSCTDDYDSEDLKAIKCYICKEAGHLCCVDYKTENPTEASCYNCGQSGHLGLECPKLNEVTNDLQPLCSKCGDRGHLLEQCIKPTSAKDAAKAAKAAKKKARKSRRRRKTPKPMSAVNASHIQPYIWWVPQITGPYYGKPGSNVWLSPAAAAARRTLNHQVRILPSRPSIIQLVGTQGINSSQNGTQIPQLPLKQENGILLPQTEPQIPINSLPNDSNSSSNLVLYEKNSNFSITSQLSNWNPGSSDNKPQVPQNTDIERSSTTS